MHFQKYIFFVVLIISSRTTGQKYNLTGTSEYATLGEAFTWTCDMFLPPGQSIFGVKFLRNNNEIVSIGIKNGECDARFKDTKYSSQCKSNIAYTLTIPANRMTEFEQTSMWRCEYVTDPVNYRSPDAILNIAIDVQNVSLFPNDNPFTISEGTQKVVRCVFNENAVPPPTITWYLQSTIITIADTDKTNYTITGNRADNTKTLQCRAANNGNTGKTASTTLNVEYKPEVINHTPKQYKVIEGQTGTLECAVKDANPNRSITWRWFRTESPTDVLHNRSTYIIPTIQRIRSGSYKCTASNSVGISVAVTIDVDVQYKPEVTTHTSNPYRVIEGKSAKLECTLTAANPNTSITWIWFKTGHPKDTLYNGQNYTIPNIQKNETGSYSCTANNSAGLSEPTSIAVDVQYPPFVNTLPKKEEIEGNNFSVICEATYGNPNLTIFFWTKTNNLLFRQNGSTLQLPNIQRTSAGTYVCTAENIYSNEEKGTHNQSMILNVIYEPNISNGNSTRVNEGDQVILTREVVSNPLSDVSWFNGTQLMKNETLRTFNASITIKNAMCTDTRNFTLVASNKVERNVTTLVELIVFCKPRSYEKNISLGVTDTTGIEFSSTIIAYPKPQYELQYENGTKNTEMMGSVTTNAVYNYTIRYNQTIVNQDDYGTFHLRVHNLYGETTVYVNVIAQRKPDMPTITDYLCEVKTARIQWESSFNGGDPQSFTVVALHGNQIENKTDTISDQGKNKIHATFVQHLQSSTTYVFSVAAHNKHGFSLSKNISCTTLEEEGANLPLVAGIAVAVGITLAIIVIALVLMFRRYTKNEEKAGKPQRLKDELGENRDTDDDGLKENILYVSADTRDIDKPEPAVYAAVNKKSQESNNNANVYAEVNKSEPKIREGALYSDVKPKKGFFKKNEQEKVGGKPKQRKGKKQKTKQETADVYENSEDIAMTPNVDNVYSNSEHKNQSETKQRGYKNKDGLLYVEVNFDGKQGQDNPVIHGEDEKTDYATVEFPMPSALNKASGSEEL